MLMNRMGTSFKTEDAEDGSGRRSFFRLPTSVLFLSDQVDEQRCAPIQTSRLFARVVVLRPLLSVADRAESIRADAPAHQVVLYGVRAALAAREVGYRRADIARVAFDFHVHSRILLRHADGFVERPQRLGPQTVAVEIEVHVLEDDWRHNRGSDDLDVDGIAGRLVVGRARDGDGHGDRTFLRRRRPRRALCGRRGKRAGGRAPRVGHAAANGVIRGRGDRRRLADFDRAWIARGLHTQIVLRGGRWRRRWWRRRRNIHADAGVVTDAPHDVHLVAGAVGRTAEELVAFVHVQAPRPAHAGKHALRTLPRQPETQIHGRLDW